MMHIYTSNYGTNNDVPLIHCQCLYLFVLPHLAGLPGDARHAKGTGNSSSRYAGRWGMGSFQGAMAVSARQEKCTAALWMLRCPRRAMVSNGVAFPRPSPTSAQRMPKSRAFFRGSWASGRRLNLSQTKSQRMLQLNQSAASCAAWWPASGAGQKPRPTRPSQARRGAAGGASCRGGGEAPRGQRRRGGDGDLGCGENEKNIYRNHLPTMKKGAIGCKGWVESI